MTSPAPNPITYGSKSKRVLIVEDEPLIAYDLRTEIEDNQHDVIGVCNTASAAIKMAGELQPDVIVMDISLLGHETGLEAGREIRERFDIGCVFVSATLDRVDPEIWDDIRPIGLVPKPYRDEMLAQAIMTDKDHWQTIDPAAKTVFSHHVKSDAKPSDEDQKTPQLATASINVVQKT